MLSANVKVILLTVFLSLSFVSSKNDDKILRGSTETVDSSNSPWDGVVDGDSKNQERKPQSHYYVIDPAAATRLAILEQEVVSVLKQEVMQGMPVNPTVEANICRGSIIKYINEFKQDSKVFTGHRYRGVIDDVSKRGNSVAANPLLLLRLLRRMVVTLFNETVKFCSEKWEDIAILEMVNETFHFAQLTPPTQQDLQDALEGLLRIQFIYGLNATSELRLGNLNGVHTNVTLHFDDCLALAEKAIQLKAEAMAYQWLVSAHLTLSADEWMVSQKSIDALGNIWQKLADLTKASTMDELHSNLGNKRQQQLYSNYNFEQYAPCRGESIPLPKTFCFYVTHLWDPYFTIHPVKAEILTANPPIVQFYQFAGERAMNMIRNSVAFPPERARTVNKGGTAMANNLRTSMTAYVFDTEMYNPHPVLVNLNRRVEKLLKMNVIKNGASNMQVSIYGTLGGHYDFHHDAFVDESPREYRNLNEGNRIATFLMFLADVEMGGNTAFLQARVAAKPIKGSAVLWYNLLRNGVPDQSTSHGGCPVILGQKQIANRWIMQYENMYKWPCTLNSDE